MSEATDTAQRTTNARQPPGRGRQASAGGGTGRSERRDPPWTSGDGRRATGPRRAETRAALGRRAEAAKPKAVDIAYADRRGSPTTEDDAMRRVSARRYRILDPGGRSRSSVRSASVAGRAGEHHAVRLDPHEGRRLEVRDHDHLAAAELLGRIVLRDPRHDRPRLGAEPHRQLEQLLRLRHRLGVQHLGDAEVEAPELLDARSGAAARRAPSAGAAAASMRERGRPASDPRPRRHAAPGSTSASRGGPPSPSWRRIPPAASGTNGSSTIPRTATPRPA